MRSPIVSIVVAATLVAASFSSAANASASFLSAAFLSAATVSATALPATFQSEEPPQSGPSQDTPARVIGEPTPRNPLPVGAAQPFTLPSLRELRLLTSSEFSGKVVLIVIFRTDCPRTQATLASLAALREKFAGRGFEILGVADENFDAAADPIDAALRFAKDHKWNGPLALNDGGEFHQGYYQRIKGTPSAYLLDRSGKLEFLGQDAGREEYLGDLEKLIESKLAEPAPKEPAPRVAVRNLPDFTLLSWKGGAIRSEELRGKPALLALLSPSQAARYGPELTALNAKYGPAGLRVIGVTFGTNKEVRDEIVARRPGYEVAIPDSEAQQNLVGDDLIPKFLFVTADGRVLKEIRTIYGLQRGIEGSVFDRYAAILLGKDVRLPELVEAKASVSKLEYRSSELGFGLDPPKGYRKAASLGDERVRFLGSTSQEITVRYDTRFGSGDEAIEKLADTIGAALPDRTIESRRWRDVNGVRSLVVREGWNSALGSVRAMRVLIPAASGVYIVTGLASEVDFKADFDAIEQSLLSFERGLTGRG